MKRSRMWLPMGRVIGRDPRAASHDAGLIAIHGFTSSQRLARLGVGVKAVSDAS